VDNGTTRTRSRHAPHGHGQGMDTATKSDAFGITSLAAAWTYSNGKLRMGPSELSKQSSRAQKVCGWASGVWSGVRSHPGDPARSLRRIWALRVFKQKLIIFLPQPSRRTKRPGGLRGAGSPAPSPCCHSVAEMSGPIRASDAIEARFLVHQQGAEARTSRDQRHSGVGLRRTARPQRACAGSMGTPGWQHGHAVPIISALAALRSEFEDEPATMGGRPWPRRPAVEHLAQEQAIAVCSASGWAVRCASPSWRRTRGTELGVCWDVRIRCLQARVHDELEAGSRLV
jgi:hypothetical protein